MGQNAEPALAALVISPSAAAILTISSRLAVVVRMVVGLIGSAVFASVSHVYAGGVERTRDVLKVLFFLSNLLLAIGLGVTMAFNGIVVSLWVGPDMYGGDVLTFLVVLSTAMGVIMTLNMSFLQSMGHFRDTSLIDIAEVPLRLLLMLALGAWIGMNGMVLAGMLATLALKAWAYPRLLGRSLQIGNHGSALLVTAGLPYLGVSVGLAIAWLRAAPAASDWVQLAAQTTMYMILIGVLVLTTSQNARRMAAVLLTPGLAQIRRALTR